jgi:hypothetical protein
VNIRDQDKFMLRLPDGMRDRIKADALVNDRSMNAEIIARLSGTQADLRNRIAMAALSGLCANPGGPFQANSMQGWGMCNCDETHVAATSYRLADAMLSARDKERT